MKTLTKFIMPLVLSLLAAADAGAQELIANVYGRQTQSLNGKWDAIGSTFPRTGTARHPS